MASAAVQVLGYRTRKAGVSGSQVLKDSYGVNHLGIALQKGLPGRLAYIGEFVEEARTSGLVQRAIDRAELRGFRVSPGASAKRP